MHNLRMQALEHFHTTPLEPAESCVKLGAPWKRRG